MTKPVQSTPTRAARKPTKAGGKPTPRGRPQGAGTVIAHQLDVSGAAVQDPGRLAYIRTLIRNVPDFPQPGILFKDITPLLADPKGFCMVIDAMTEHFIAERPAAIVGIESRGFIFGGALAARLNTSFIPVRKPGKLPAAVDRVAYSLEYGKAELEMHKGSLCRGARVVVVDDLLATGGTAAAAAQLVQGQGGCVCSYAFVIELSFLDGRNKLDGVPIFSLMNFGTGE